MPRWTYAQLVLLELAAAAGVGGWALGAAWRIAGVAVAAVLAAAALVPLTRRWLYQAALSWAGMIARRRRVTGSPGLVGVLGEYEVITVAGGSSGIDLGVVRAGTTWCLPLVLGLGGIFADDPPVPLAVLRDLLRVEDVTLSSVRLFTLVAPARVPADAPAGPVAAPSPLAARYCLLTLDTRVAGDAVAARGGSTAAIGQILRRCAVNAQQALAPVGIDVRRMGADEVRGLFAAWLGPAAAQEGRRADRAVESWRELRVAGTWSSVFAVGGSGADVLERAGRLAGSASAAVVGTALVLRRSARSAGAAPGAGTRAEPGEATLLLRLSAPDQAAGRAAGRSLGLLARAYDLVLQPLGGEQAPMLAATLPVGVGEAA